MHHISLSRRRRSFCFVWLFSGFEGERHRRRERERERERGIRVGFCCSVSESFLLFWVLAMMLLVEEEMGVLGFRDMGRNFLSYGMTSSSW
jgi:hypothetical protein